MNNINELISSGKVYFIKDKIEYAILQYLTSFYSFLLVTDETLFLFYLSF
jgi:hypothetical protein